MGEESFHAKIEKEHFKHYYTLLPIMSDRACMGSSTTTDLYYVRDKNDLSDQQDEAEDSDEVEILTSVHDIAFQHEMSSDERSV